MIELLLCHFVQVVMTATLVMNVWSGPGHDYRKLASGVIEICAMICVEAVTILVSSAAFNNLCMDLRVSKQRHVFTVMDGLIAARFRHAEREKGLENKWRVRQACGLQNLVVQHLCRRV